MQKIHALFDQGKIQIYSGGDMSGGMYSKDRLEYSEMIRMILEMFSMLMKMPKNHTIDVGIVPLV